MALKHPPVGAHIYSSRGVYDHHGIYVGRNRVIHHSGFTEAFVKGPIAMTSLEAFCAGGDFQVRTYEKSTFPRQEIVLRARQLLKTGGNDYHLFSNNCEHFATWCATGVHESLQVQEAQETAQLAAAAHAAHAAYQQAAQEKLIKVGTSMLSGAVAGATAGAGTGALIGSTAAVVGLATAPISLPLVAALGLAGGLLGFLMDD